MCRWCEIARYWTIEITPEQAKRILDVAPLTQDETKYLRKVAKGEKAMIPLKAADKLAKWKAQRTVATEVANG